MKLFFHKSPLWEPERYRYAAEQMMLTLFPGERPEYPAEEPNIHEGDGVVFTLIPGDRTALLSAELGWRGDVASGRFELPLSALQDTPERVYHEIQHGLKLAFYQAGVELLGQEPPWGALTGVRPVKLPTRAMAAGDTPEQACEMLERKYCVSPARAKLAVDCARASLAVWRSLAPEEVSLYIGVPFCPTRCAYCSFVSADVGRTLKLVEPFVEALLVEMDATAQALRQAGLRVRSFYMGGGTPTTLNAGQLDRILARCRQALPMEGCTEYTVEAGRPDTITREKLEVLRANGVGRISINPQTLEDHVLAAIGRRHSAADIRACYELAREVGFDSINMDLIAGLPQDSFEGFRRSLNGVLAMGPENITVHTLALKKGSKLGALGKGGALVGERTSGGMSEPSCLREGERYKARKDEMAEGGALPVGPEVVKMLDFSRNLLTQRGYLPYYLYRQKYMSGSLENVGWALPGKESLYNIVMMEELQTVVSLGGGGMTKLIDQKNGRILRLSNPKYPLEYLNTLEQVTQQKRDLAGFYR